MNKKLLTTALLIVLPFLFTACTLGDLPVVGKYFGGGSVTETPVTLNVWGLWESPEVMDELVSKYQEIHPNVTINYDDRTIIKSDQYRETIYNRLTMDDTPDIVLAHNSWISDLRDYLAPATDVYTSEEFAQKYYPVSAAAGIMDGKVYAVPAYYDGLALVYNKDHFDEIDQTTPPTRWEEFRKLAIDLTIKGGDNEPLVRAGAAMGVTENIDFASDIYGMMLEQAGVSVPSELTSKAAQDALYFYTMFYKDFGVWDVTYPEASSAFAQGKVSMIFIPSWDLLEILKSSPNINLGVAPVPQARPETPVSWGSFWMYVVSKKSSNSKAAWDFIKFISEDEQQLTMFSEASKYRPYGAPFASVNLKDQISQGSNAQFLKGYLDPAPYAKVNRLANRSGNKVIIDAFKTNVSKMYASGAETITAEEALTGIKKAFTN